MGTRSKVTLPRCKDCIHYILIVKPYYHLNLYDLSVPTCLHEYSRDKSKDIIKKGHYDYVRGIDKVESVVTGFNSCNTMRTRQGSQVWDEAWCGKEARLFERKPGIFRWDLKLNLDMSVLWKNMLCSLKWLFRGQ